MRTTTTLITGLVLALLATPAAAAKAPCPGGRFIVANPPDQPLFAEEPGTGLHVLTVSPLRRGKKLVLSLPDGTSTKGTRRFTMRDRGLAFQFDESCATITGTLSVPIDAGGARFILRRDRTRVVRFTAHRSRCGDGITDPMRREACEADVECDVSSTCSSTCDCVTPPDGTPTSTTTTSTTLAGPPPTTSTTTPTTIPDDLDGDCIPNDWEAYLGTQADDWDSDGDGVRDGDEDPDGDGLTSCTELFALGTDPGSWDTDGDEDDDGSEVAIHTDPLDPESQPLYPAEVLHQRLEHGTDTDLLAFTLQSSRRVFLRVADSEHRESLQPCLTLYNAAGDSIYPHRRCTDDVTTIIHDLVAGTYYVRVSDFDGIGDGPYRLEYVPVHPDAAVLLPDGPDAYVDADMDSGAELHLYRFELQTTRRVFIRVSDRTRSGDGFQVCYNLLRATGEQVYAAEGCGEDAAGRDIDLPAGTYYLLVSEQNASGGGTYRVRALPLTDETSRALAPGETCRTLSDPVDVDAYDFTLTALATKQLSIRKTGGGEGFTPCFAVYANGVDLVYNSPTCGAAALKALTLNAGTYHVVVLDNDGNAAGSYCIGRD